MTRTTATTATTLHACCWSTVSCAAGEVARVQELAARLHPGAAVVVSCQRVEAYSASPCDCEAPAHFADGQALQHLAEVAAGLHSVVLGEEQILGQVRRAFDTSLPALRRVADIALASARELRRETDFNSHAGALLDRALKTAGMTPGGTLLVLGGGQLGRLVARRGRETGFADVIIASRTRPPEIEGVRYVPLSRASALEPVAVIAGCLGSAAGEVLPASLPAAALLADLGTPRNFAEGQDAPVVTLADMLADEHARPHAMKRRGELRARLTGIVDARAAAALRSGSPIAGLRFEVERIRQRELARMMKLHPDLPADALDAFARALVNQLFHGPSARLKSDPALGEKVAELFAPA